MEQHLHTLIINSTKRMKMKIILSLVVIVGCLFSPVSVNFEVLALHDSKEILESEPIFFEGDLDPGPGLRSGGIVVTAEVQGNVILALFHKDVGNLLVTISDDSGNTVYEATINTSVQQQVFIPFSGLSSGIYTITFSNNFGSMYGDFQI